MGKHRVWKVSNCIEHKNLPGLVFAKMNTASCHTPIYTLLLGLPLSSVSCRVFYEYFL